MHLIYLTQLPLNVLNIYISLQVGQKFILYKSVENLM